MSSIVREQSHAGSWYEDDPHVLNSQLTNWLEKAKDPKHGPARVIISPHAGYYYCGATAAHAYKEINNEKIKRVFVLGPAHHIRLSGCALSKSDYCETPFGKLKVDKETNRNLLASKLFKEVNKRDEEDEHSLEMLLPFLAKVMEGKDFEIVPIMVGSLGDQEALYANVFSPYLLNEENLFAISSDFCHWGSRFQYEYYDRNWGEIWESIKKLDRLGMDAIETCDPAVFRDYQKRYSNTICGRNPIAIILSTISKIKNDNPNLKVSLKFLDYSQSSKCRSPSDSSVSYASASVTITSN